MQLKDYSLSPNRNILTERELQILLLIAEELSTREIAEKLTIKIGTVEAHRKSLFFKLKAKNMAGLIHQAYQKGILSIHNS